MHRSIKAALLLLVAVPWLTAGQYTNRMTIKLKALGESTEGDPVAAFNDAVENATQKAESRGQGLLKGRSESQDNVLDSVWIQKNAHLQMVDLRVSKYRFFKEPKAGPNSILTEVETRVTLEYLDYPRYIEDLEKTETGATLRSMAIPGWGQWYNNQHTTSILYATAFWSFYALFVNAVQNANGDSARISEATLEFQLPAIIFWVFNVSEATTSRYLMRQGLNNLGKAYQFDYTPEYVSKTERGLKLDFIFFEAPLYEIWQ